MATVQKSSKINFYKFVQVKEPSGGQVGQSENVAITKALNSNTKAVNNLGATVNSLAKVLTDLKKISIIDLEREQKKQNSFRAKFAKEKAEKRDNSFLGNLGANKTTSFLENLLGLLGNLFKFYIGNEVLKWIADPNNQETVRNVIDGIVKVGKFIFEWGKFGITNTIDGLYNLLKDDATWQERLTGFGQAIVGIGSIVLGVRYLSNPTKIITDITRGVRSLIRFVTGGGRRPRGPGGPGGPRNRAGGLTRFVAGTALTLGTGYALSQMEYAKGGKIKKQASGGGWINGPMSGYPVSLDGGKSTSFIGHGREYVARKAGGGAFVVPFNTPATQRMSNLTSQRIAEAKKGGYQLPGFASGGLVGGTPGNPSNPKQRKIFLHWSGGFHNATGGLPYHQVFSGSGKPNSTNVNYGVDKYAHTAGHNTNSIGLGAAAMGHTGMSNTYYDDKKGWAQNPLTNAQTTAMAKEAANLMKAYGQKTSDVDRNVWTHGEWERHAVKTGLLPSPVQRWDLDSLKPGPYNHPGGFFSTKQIRSQGGNEMRAKIKSFMSGSGSELPSNSPEEKGRGIMSRFLGAVDAMTGNRTDFDGMGGGGSSASSPTTDTSSSERLQTAEKGQGYGYGALLDLIGKRESDSSGGYDAVNQIGTKGGHGVEGYAGPFSGMSQHGGKKLTSLTVKEVMALQSGWAGPMSNAEWISKGKLHAVGRYQFIGPTLASLVSQGHAKPGDKFNESTQNKLAVALIKQVGTSPSALKGTWIGLTHETDAAVRAAVGKGGDSTHGTNGGGASYTGSGGSSGHGGSLIGSSDAAAGRGLIGGLTGSASTRSKTSMGDYSQSSTGIRAGQRLDGSSVQQMQQATQQRNEAKQRILQFAQDGVQQMVSQVTQNNSTANMAAQNAMQVVSTMAQNQQQGAPIMSGTASGIIKTTASVLNSFNNPLKGILK